MEKNNYKIGVDISGGDYAPSEIFKGAVNAQKEFHENIVLIGVKKEIEEEARRMKVNLDGFTVVDAPEKIEMSESPVTAVRRKRDSSIVVGSQLLKDGKIDAFVSCGNTGAIVCAATLTLRPIEGVERPGIAILMPTRKNVSILLDAGANIEPKPLHLFQYGIMASSYYKTVLNKENPTVGLLNIGEEETKGTDFVKRVHKLFSASSLNFIGNVEPKELFSGNCDCIICDGLMGNVALKVSEGCGKFMVRSFFELVNQDFFAKIGFLFMGQAFKKIKRIFDYSEYGGALLLGVDGVVIKGHGRSSHIAVKNAIKVAIKELQWELNTEIKRRINEVCNDSRIREILTS